MLYPVLQDPLHPIVSSLFDRPRGASIGQMLFGAGEQGGWYDVSDMSTTALPSKEVRTSHSRTAPARSVPRGWQSPPPVTIRRDTKRR